MRKCNDIGNFWHREEIGGVIRLLGAKCASSIAVHRQLMQVCGNDGMECQKVVHGVREKNTYLGVMVTMIAAALVGCARRMSEGTEFVKQASHLGGRGFRDTKETLVAVRGWLRTQ